MGAGNMVPRLLLEDASVISGKALERGPWYLRESTLTHITNAASHLILFFLPLVQMCPAPSSVHREPICCECQAKFGGRLPVRRAEAMLPYWVPLSLTPKAGR
ncbi:hypothetical protein E2I00_010554 [Balaenoptera physalus]|uniref:Uncharacterized protein n=1 Tax=Balaenoptera physalus TaxID=9770 RepID=A0A6A1Q6Z8_BALPH|nr:hypothetical protein E2I00_010554 [Balaenoptera physalus]